jgi:predicted Zn-dependent peptidase
VLGQETTISSMKVHDVADFHAEHYRPGNIVVAAAGLVDHDQVVDGLARRLGRRSGGKAPIRAAPGGAALARLDVARETEQAHLTVAVAAPDRDDDDRHAMAIIEHVIGGGMSSRLFQAIREERGLAYSVYSYRLSFKGAGALALYAGTSPANAAQVLELMEAEIARIGSEGITAEEMEAAKSHVRGAMALGLEDSGARMSRIGHARLVHGRVLSLDEIYDRLASMTLDQINDVAARWLRGPRTVATVGPATS